ncbi:MAG: queuine tRNA-ribosyltransferase [Myxococcaceae bacterium]|nr:queuine tRNA-ribosyltransferase [Myxococcaceae bacterium]
MSDGRLGCEVIVTRTGVQAMLDLETGEVMHPIGPTLEAELMYVAPSRLAERLALANPDPLVLFDIGLGAASNAIAAWRVSDQLSADARRLQIVSFDHSLQPLELALQPEHAAVFALEGRAGEAARALLTGDGVYRSPRTDWSMHLSDLLVALAAQPDAVADIVFWDVYSARGCPALWTVQTFRSLRRVCRHGATVHTYSGAIAARAAMLLAGFAVGLGPSSGAKQKHSTIAATHVDVLERPLDRAWLERLLKADAMLPGDAPSDALEQLAAMPQFAR